MTLCVVPEAPENGDVRVTGVTVSSTATYSCNRGFQLTGNGTRICLHSGEWSEEPSTCQSMSFHLYTNILSLIFLLQPSVVVHLQVH